MPFLLSLFTGSNSLTVVLSKPASYSSIVLCPNKIREHAYQSIIVVSRYGEITEVVRLKYVSGCGKSTIKVYGRSTREVSTVKKTVKVQSSTVKGQYSTVKVQYCTETFFWHLL